MIWREPPNPKGYTFKSYHGTEEGRPNLVPGLFVQVTGDNNPDSERFIIFQPKPTAELYCKAGSTKVQFGD